VDEYVSARIPPLPRMDDHSPEAMQQRRLWHLVMKNMMHDCNDECLVTAAESVQRRCNKRFPKDYHEHTEISGFFFLVFYSFLLANRYTEYVRVAPGDANPIIDPSVSTTTNEKSTPQPHGKTKEPQQTHGKTTEPLQPHGKTTEPLQTHGKSTREEPQTSDPTMCVDDDDGSYVFFWHSFILFL
jgi:hypothetical protein